MTAGPPAPTALCALAELADGTARGFDPLGQGHDTMFVVRKGGAVYGWRNLCPHRGHDRMAWVKDGYLTHDGARILCGAHGAEYEIETGICVAGPCLGRRLTPVPLALRAGEVVLRERFTRRKPNPA